MRFRKGFVTKFFSKLLSQEKLVNKKAKIWQKILVYNMLKLAQKKILM